MTATDDDERQPLHVAAFSGNARTVSHLLPHVPHDGRNAPSGDGLTPLHYAALSGSAAVVRLLVRVPHPTLPLSLAVSQLGSRASSGRAWRLWAARHSQEEAGPPQPRPPRR